MTATMSIVESGEWLAAQLAESDQREAGFLEVLAEFDLAEGWAADGQLSCVEWLMWRGRMGRATAYEKLMVAHQLRCRPALRDALASGRVSYSAVRVLARMEGADPEVDRAMVELAEAGTVRDLERMVMVYRRHADQHRPPSAAWLKRGVRVHRGLDGTSTVEITLSDLEVEELLAAVQAFVDQELAAQSAAESNPDQSARADSAAPLDEPTWGTRQADAVMDLVRTGLAHARDGHAAGGDRYMVHVVSLAGAMQTVDGTPIDPVTAERIACDSSSVRHLLGPGWEPLALGRKTKEWSTAQRRAVTVRDGGRCRFVGCYNSRCDVHHHLSWEEGGPTDTANGYLQCPRHHTLLHRGYFASGTPDGELTFHRPDGRIIGTTRPRAAMMVR